MIRARGATRAAGKVELMELLILFLLGGGFAALVAVARHQRAERRAAAATVSFAVDDWGVRRSRSRTAGTRR